jgi:hypothetical protein
MINPRTLVCLSIAVYQHLWAYGVRSSTITPIQFLLDPSIAISHKIQYSNSMLTCAIPVANPEHIHRAHTHLYNTVFGHRRAFSSSPASAPARARAPAINGDTLAVVNGTAASASSAITQQHGMLGQRPLPDGPFFSTLPIREQALAVASLEDSLPVVSALSPAPEQEGREHGVLLLLDGQEKEEVVDEVQDEEDGDVEL